MLRLRMVAAYRAKIRFQQAPKRRFGQLALEPAARPLGGAEEAPLFRFDPTERVATFHAPDATTSLRDNGRKDDDTLSLIQQLLRNIIRHIQDFLQHGAGILHPSLFLLLGLEWSGRKKDNRGKREMTRASF